MLTERKATDMRDSFEDVTSSGKGKETESCFGGGGGRLFAERGGVLQVEVTKRVLKEAPKKGSGKKPEQNFRILQGGGPGDEQNANRQATRA